MIGVIYKITNILNGKAYIGQTINFKDRKKNHLQAKDKYSIHKAIQKYGKDNFLWEILEECQKEDLNDREIFWIKYYDTYYNGYNETKGGDNADALVKWINEHKEEHLIQAKKNLIKANEYLKTHREEHLKQLALARQKGINARKKKVRCIEKQLVFNSLSDAEKWSLSQDNDNHRKAAHQHISKVCSGQRRTCGGYHWEYVE